MALSLIANYSSDNSDDSDDSDDGIIVVIHKNPHHALKRPAPNDFNKDKNGGRNAKKRQSLPNGVSGPAAQARARVKVAKTESVLDNVHRPELEEKFESIPLPSTVLTMFDKTKEQEVIFKLST